MKYIQCLLCGCKDDFEIYTDARNRVVMCNHCTLVYLNPRMSDEEYRAFYKDSYQISRHEIHGYQEAVGRLEKKGSYERKIRRFEFFKDCLNEKSDVLEIGAGMGTLLKVIKDKVNCQVRGIEISELAARVANEYYNVPVTNGTLEEYIAQDAKKRFNFIILHHVLEHFTNPLSVLKQLNNILSNSGYLYIAVPNVASPDEPLDRFFRMVHCYYFTPLTLNKILTKAGWKIIKLDIGHQEIRIIAVKIYNQLPAIANDFIEGKYSKQRILQVIKRQKLKYKLLRIMKRIVENALPKRLLSPLRWMVILVLRKMKIIKV